ncbi:Arm DNA-binding domain-containing protein [Mucilaginibacter sp. PAMB04274]|uniref:Arm DNA-binding domain-containing protein n=1 Tax=Mucilaginibacter sp. PAMB04274 TaxID=3138568 RepID=UPI00331D3C19
MCYAGKELWIDVFLKTTKNQIETLRSIYVKITVDGKATELSTKRKCELSRWSTAAGRASGNKESTKELNYYLDTLVFTTQVL